MGHIRKAMEKFSPDPLSVSYVTATDSRSNKEGEVKKVGAVLQDGGVPVCGFARELAPESWHEIVREMFLTRSGK